MLRPAATRTARIRSEDGATAVLVAIVTTILLVATGFVLDFGMARFDKQMNKSASDAAALAGVRAMSQDTAVLRPWAGVCGALDYLQVNKPDVGPGLMAGSFTKGDGSGIAAPCSSPALMHATCDPTDSSSWARYDGTVGPVGNPEITVEIRAGYDVQDPRFSEENLASLHTDTGKPSLGGCDNLAVIITQRRKPGLGSLVTDGPLVTLVRSVARVTDDDRGKSPVALLILEQHDCAAVNTDGSTTKLWVKGTGLIPGLIHSDSLGDTPGSTGRCNTDKVVGGTGQVKAFMAATGGALGVIGIRALRTADGGIAANAYDPSPAVVAEGQPADAPEPRPLVTRSKVDERYLAPVTAKVQAVWPMFSWNSATAAANGYTWVTPPHCGGSGITGTFTQARIYLDCPGGAIFSDATFTGESVIVNGPVGIKSGTTLALPAATSFYVKGPGTSASNAKGLDIDGRLRLHDSTDSACAVHDSPTSGRSELVVGSGYVNATNASSLLRLCHTTLIAIGNDPTMPAFADPAPAPSNNGRNGYLSINGGSQDWTAPNLKVNVPSTATDWANFEDLALWTETSAESTVGGNGTMHLSGIFMLPNANPFTIGGTGSQDVTNSQYITRKLHAHGGGQLVMQPDPNDVIKVKYYGNYQLVR